MDGTQRAGTASQSSFSLFLEVVSWLTKEWAFLAGAVVVIGMGYGLEFRAVYAIPVTFGSPSVLSALPALSAVVLSGVAVVTAFALVPSLALWITVGPDKRRLIDGHRASPAGRYRNPFTSPDLGRAWVAIQVMVVATVFVALTASAADNEAVSWLSAIAVLSVLALSVLVLRPVRRRAGIHGSGAWGLDALVVFCTVFQCFVANEVAHGVFSVTSDKTLLGTWNHGVVAFGFFVAILGGQFYVGTQIKEGIRLRTFQKLVMTVLAIAALPLLYPPLGARIGASAFRQTDGQGKSCVTLIPSSKAVSADWVDVMPDNGPLSTSLPLEFAALIDGYQVKRHLEGDTFTIPAEQVRRVAACPAEG